MSLYVLLKVCLLRYKCKTHIIHVTENCPKYVMSGLKTDETDPHGVKIRADFKLFPAKSITGTLVSQKIELEYISDGSIQLEQCDNCEWNRSSNGTIDYSPRNIGPLKRDVNYIPVITISSEFNITSNLYESKGFIDQSCRAVPFATSYWICADGKQFISSSAVCNDHLNPDCEDGSDEDEIRCKGSLGYLPHILVGVYFVLGYILVYPSNFRNY